MRFLVKVAVVLALLWCGAWALGSFAISAGINKALEDLRAQGWQAQAETSKGGFPFSITTQVRKVSLVNPATSDRLELDGARIKARPYWPGHLDVDLPATPIVFGTPDAQGTFTAANGTFGLRLRPGLSLELGSGALTTSDWSLTSERSEILRGDALMLVADQSAAGSPRYDVSMALDALSLGEGLRGVLALPAALPDAFQTVTAKGAVVFDGPLTRARLNDGPLFTQIILDGAQVDWGGIALRAMGALDVDARGIPSGTIEMQAKDWRNLLDLAQSAGLLPTDRRGQAELMFGLLAARGGSRDDLDLELAFRDGNMSVSGLPLGPAPRIVWP